MFFRQRNNIDVRDNMQIDTLDQSTKNLLYTIFTHSMGDKLYMRGDYGRTNRNYLSENISFIIAHILKARIKPNDCYKSTFLEKFFDEYDYSYILEFFERTYRSIQDKDAYIGVINNTLEEEKLNYRINKEGQFIKVCNNTEFDSLNETSSNSKGAVKDHFDKAVLEYSKRDKNINYDEVCNESIKAVEALARKLLGKEYKDKTLGQCLDPLRQKLNIPMFAYKPIKEIWEDSNRGDTSTRHAKYEGSNQSTGEPKAYFILITCSSFINYMYKTHSDKL